MTGSTEKGSAVGIGQRVAVAVLDGGVPVAVRSDVGVFEAVGVFWRCVGRVRVGTTVGLGKRKIL